MEQNNTLGICLSLVAALIQIVVNLLIKRFYGLHPNYSPMNYNFLRGIFGMSVSPIIFFGRGQDIKKQENFDVGQVKFLAFRCFVATIGFSFMIVAMTNTKLSTFSSVGSVWPALTVFFASKLLDEQIKPVDYLAIGGSLLCSLLITKPFSSEEAKGDSLLGIFALCIYIVTMALAQNLNRMMNGKFAVELTMMFQSMAVVVVSYPMNILIFGKDNKDLIAFYHLPDIFIIMIFAYSNQLIVQISSRIATMTYLAPVRYSSIAFGFVASWMFLDEGLDWMSIVGGIGIFVFNIIKLFN